MDDQQDLIDLSEYPKQVTLAGGTEVWLRPMRKDDRDRLHKFFRELPVRNLRYFKHDVTQREVVSNWCENLDYDAVFPILGVVKEGPHEKVVADATLHTDRHGWATHVARIRWVVSRDMRKLGLGKYLLRELLERAAARGILKIQADIRQDNENSKALLKRLGFKKEAVFKKHASDQQGRLHDVVVFSNLLDDLWQKMDDLNIDSDFCLLP